MPVSNRRPTAMYLGWEGESVSQQVLRILSDYFEINFAQEFAFGDKVDQKELGNLKPDYLFCFGPLIVRKELLQNVQQQAINFHPAPPKWPGRGSCSFALYAGDPSFGLTAHEVIEEIDAGAILKCLEFSIDPADDAETLHAKTLSRIPELVSLTCEALCKQKRLSPNGHQWSGPAKKMSEMKDLMYISLGDSPSEISKKIRAFSHSKKPGPYVVLNGFEFWFQKPKQ